MEDPKGSEGGHVGKDFPVNDTTWYNDKNEPGERERGGQAGTGKPELRPTYGDAWDA